MSNNKEYMLTTLDNPYNPHTAFDDWYSFDTSQGYNTLAYLDRIAIVPEELSDIDKELAIDEAIDSIVLLNLTGNYIKVDEDYEPRMKVDT